MPCHSRIVLDDKQLISGPPGPRLNASIIRYCNRWFMAYRTGWAGAEVHIAVLDEKFCVMASQVLALRHRQANYGREDPRLFVFKNRLHVSFIGTQAGDVGLQTHQLYARLSPDGLSVEEVFAPHYSLRKSWEKNWSFFEFSGKLHAVYSISPHTVLEIDGNQVLSADHTVNAYPWTGGRLRGGAPAVRVGDNYYHWFHGCSGEWTGRLYNVGLYVFRASPPFEIIRQTANPIIENDLKTKPEGQYCPVIFPAGAVLYNGKWVVSCGIHDRWIEILQWDYADIESLL